jgi:hypothetical protein
LRFWCAVRLFASTDLLQGLGVLRGRSSTLGFRRVISWATLLCQFILPCTTERRCVQCAKCSSVVLLLSSCCFVALEMSYFWGFFCCVCRYANAKRRKDSAVAFMLLVSTTAGELSSSCFMDLSSLVPRCIVWCLSEHCSLPARGGGLFDVLSPLCAA